MGSRDARYPEAGRLAAKLGVERDVIQTGYIPDDQLVQEYQQADVFVLPSQYEGFGLPVLEALAAGAPVVSTREGALPEVGGTAVTYTSGRDPEALAVAIRAVVAWPPEIRAHHVAAGRAHALTFTWAATAGRTFDALRRAAEVGGRW